MKQYNPKIKWFSANGKHYYCIAYCKKHGYLKGKARMKKADDGNVYVVKTKKIISLTDISEKMGSEIADIDYEDGWIRRFSKLDTTDSMKWE